MFARSPPPPPLWPGTPGGAMPAGNPINADKLPFRLPATCCPPSDDGRLSPPRLFPVGSLKLGLRELAPLPMLVVFYFFPCSSAVPFVSYTSSFTVPYRTFSGFQVRRRRWTTTAARAGGVCVLCVQTKSGLDVVRNAVPQFHPHTHTLSKVSNSGSTTCHEHRDDQAKGLLPRCRHH
jgi:hypothetical protein